MDDLAEVTLITQMLAGTARWEAATGRRMLQKPLREAIWFVWQHPRLPRPLMRGNYPMSVRWTAAARAAHAEDPARPLVIEHVEPIRDLIRWLMPLAGDSGAVAGTTSGRPVLRANPDGGQGTARRLDRQRGPVDALHPCGH